MSLKAKLEAVIYASEEPVTLTQLAQLFAGDVLEWQAARAAASQEATAEMAEASAREGELALMPDGLEMAPVADTAAMMAQAVQEAATAASTNRVPDEGEEEMASLASTAEAGEEPAGVDAVPEPRLDPEAEARRLARQRDREIKGILKQILDELIASSTSDDRGVEIREIAGGYRMATKPECHDAVRLFVKSLKPPLKLSLPALETLAVVAYKQPVTAPEVSEIRGVESGGVIGSLLARKLIATAGRKQVIGRPILYKTTKEFLLRFGLKDVNELPSMEEFEKMAAAEMEEMEPEAAAADAAQEAAEAAEATAAAEAAEPVNYAGEADGTVETAGASEGEEAGDIGEAVPGAEATLATRSGTEVAEGEVVEEFAETISNEQASEGTIKTPTDVMSATPNEQDAAAGAAGAAPHAEPEDPAQAEHEATPHAKEDEEEHRA